MAGENQYTALICSLPACDTLFDAKNTPISRFQLQRRLRELSPNDHRDIGYLGEILDWFQQPYERTDQQLLQLFDVYQQQIESEEIRAMLQWRMSFRSVVAALRRRQQGKDFPKEPWAYGRWVPLMKKNWQQPALGLEKRLPWVANAVQYLREERAMELEKLVMKVVWQWLARLAWQHEFDLPAVAIYRMRWDLISRWVCYAKEPAQQRFETMVNDLVASAAGAEFQLQMPERD